MKWTFYTMIFSVFLCWTALAAPNSTRFQGQVDALLAKKHDFSKDKALVVFAGSSSIVRWKDLESCFPGYNVRNHGFGGSEFADLIHFYDELIGRHAPDILFIYEGDNDLARGKSPSAVFERAQELVAKIRAELPRTKVILISPKPCIANWEKRASYQTLNAMLEAYCETQDNLAFANVWEAMVDGAGVVFQDIFVEDGDHMNEKGYGLWLQVIGPFLD